MLPANPGLNLMGGRAPRLAGRTTAMLSQIFPADCPDIKINSFFQQDRAPPLTSKLALGWLEERFPDRLISNKSKFLWPPRSPDLNPCDFLWGYMKEEVTKNNPMNTVELKENVTEALQSIPPDMLQPVNAEFIRRVGKCIKVSGGIFEL